MRVFRKSMFTLIPAIVAVMALAWYGCGSDDEGPAGPGGGTSAGTGEFIDSPVEGMTYSSGSKSGTTDANGTYEYEGSNITFSIGDITIGSGTPSKKMSPVELGGEQATIFDPLVLNIARFLQTMDDDGNPANGIKIPQAVQNAAAGKTVDFSSQTFDQDQNVMDVVRDLTQQTQAGERPLVDQQTAENHLASTLMQARAGSYSGVVWEQNDNDQDVQIGTWSATIGTDGIVTGTAVVRGDQIALQGDLGASGELNVFSPPPSSYTIYGIVTLAGSVTQGRWYGPLETMGEITGNKQ